MNTTTPAIHSMTSLREAVLILEKKQEREGQDLRDHFRLTFDSIRPLNLIKSAFTEVRESQDIKDHLVSTGVGLVAGHVSKKAFESVSHSPVKQLIGTAIQFGVTNVVARHPDLVLAAGKGLFHLIRNAMRRSEDDSELETSAAHNAQQAEK